MSTYRARPLTVRAYQFDGSYDSFLTIQAALPPELDMRYRESLDGAYVGIGTETMGTLWLQKDHWVVYHGGLEFTLTSPGHFAACYEPVPLFCVVCGDELRAAGPDRICACFAP